MYVGIAKKFVGTVDILFSERRAGEINATSIVRHFSWPQALGKKKSLLDDVVVITGNEIGLKTTIAQIHLIEYLSEAWIVIDLHSVDRETGQKHHDKER